MHIYPYIIIIITVLPLLLLITMMILIKCILYLIIFPSRTINQYLDMSLFFSSMFNLYKGDIGGSIFQDWHWKMFFWGLRIVSSLLGPPAEIWILRYDGWQDIPGWKQMPDGLKGYLARMLCVQFADTLKHANLKERWIALMLMKCGNGDLVDIPSFNLLREKFQSRHFPLKIISCLEDELIGQKKNAMCKSWLLPVLPWRGASGNWRVCEVCYGRWHIYI